MKIIVAHRSPDLDAICSIWLIKRFIEGWENAEVQFVPAGERLKGLSKEFEGPIELFDDNQVIHVDTGLGPLDHHQTQSNEVCAASLTYEYVKTHPHNSLLTNEIKHEAIKQIVEFTINEDHFQEVFYDTKLSHLYDFSVARLIDGFKVLHPQEDTLCVQFGMECLDIVMHVLERRIWAEREIAEKGIEFTTRFGKGLAVESLNDTVLEVAQKEGYIVTVRKDPNHGNIRIKAHPRKRTKDKKGKTQEKEELSLEPVYKRLLELDPKASWYLHVSNKMLLNGSSKNPTMSGSKLTLPEVIEAIKKL